MELFERILQAALLTMAAVFLVLGVHGCQQEQWHREAVLHGKAEYFINTNLQREWRWKP